MCGPARATWFRGTAQTIRVVADFDMVNYPSDAEFTLPLSPVAGSVQARVDYHLVSVAQSAQTAPPHFVGLPGQGSGQGSTLKVAGGRV